MGHLPEEVLFVDETFLTVDRQRIEFLKQEALKNKRTRIRLCTHANMSNSVHEMLIVHVKGNYIPPHKHINKSESFHVIEGSADLFFFDENGEIIKIISMGDTNSGKVFYYRVSQAIYHTLIVTSDIFVFHETTRGPFIPSETIFGSWAPHEDDEKAVKIYMDELMERKKKMSNVSVEIS